MVEIHLYFLACSFRSKACWFNDYRQTRSVINCEPNLCACVRLQAVLGPARMWQAL